MNYKLGTFTPAGPCAGVKWFEVGTDQKTAEDLETTYRICKEFGFDERLTAEMCWNTAYGLGRKRWHWGPAWMVTVRGWINTQLGKLGIRPLV